MDMTDEYTALQKYISTYRDPKAADAEANQAKDGADAKKGKEWWQVCVHLRLTAARRMVTNFASVLASGQLQPGHRQGCWCRARGVARGRHQAGYLQQRC